MKKKRSLMLLMAVVLATVYLVYIVSYFMKDADTTAGSLAAMLVLPHIVILLFGVVFGWIGYLVRKTALSLTAAILYSVSAAVFMMYALFLLPSIVFGFLGWGKQKKLNSDRKEETTRKEEVPD